MGPTWVLLAPGGPHVGPMNLAPWECTVRLWCTVGMNCIIYNSCPQDTATTKYSLILYYCRVGQIIVVDLPQVQINLHCVTILIRIDWIRILLSWPEIIFVIRKSSFVDTQWRTYDAENVRKSCECSYNCKIHIVCAMENSKVCHCTMVITSLTGVIW